MYKRLDQPDRMPWNIWHFGLISAAKPWLSPVTFDGERHGWHNFYNYNSPIEGVQIEDDFHLDRKQALELQIRAWWTFNRHCPDLSPLDCWHCPASAIVGIHSSFVTTGCFICFMEVHCREYILTFMPMFGKRYVVCRFRIRCFIAQSVCLEKKCLSCFVGKGGGRVCSTWIAQKNHLHRSYLQTIEQPQQNTSLHAGCLYT